MSDPKLSSQECKEMDRFMKFLALKAAQIIVQSRLGEKIRTECKPQNPVKTSWFYLAVEDLPEVLERARCVMYMSKSRVPLCVEISLRTEEGHSMVLETWCVGVTPEVDLAARITFTIYNRMAVLLKSLVSVTRCTPAYKLSRRQTMDNHSYVICYRLYHGEPQLNNLGEGYNTIKVGQLPTPVGTVQVSCYYRTKMTLSPQPSKEAAILLKSDHFQSDYTTHSPTNNSDEITSSLGDTIKMGAFVESADRDLRLERLSQTEDIPFSNLLMNSGGGTKGGGGNRNEPEEEQDIFLEQPPSSSPPDQESDKNGNLTPLHSRSATQEDYIFVDFVRDLKTPFAAASGGSTNANTDHLGLFYRECQSAPQLEAFGTEHPVSEQVGDLTQQLEAFEVHLKEYDNVITEYCAENNN